MAIAENGVLFLYVASLAFALVYGGFRKEVLFRLGFSFLLLGFLLQTLTLGRSWATYGTVPATNLYEVLILTSWAIVCSFLVFFPFIKSKVMLFFLMPLVVLAHLTAGFAANIPREPKPFFYTPWFTFHILMLIFGISLFLLSFIYSSIFIMQDHSLRHRRAPSPLNVPSLEQASKWATRFLVLGYILFTVGFVSAMLYGILYGKKQDWHPGLLEFASTAALVILGVAIYGWVTAKLNPRKRSWLVVAGAASSVLIILGILWH
ncbi:MAG: cytochrome c biogenesis protein CcsA [Acidobacteriota bacterium]